MKKFIGVLASFLTLAGAAYAQSKPQANPQSIIVNPTPTELQVRVGVDRAGDNPIYDIGDNIRINVSVNQDAYVYLFSVHSDGNIDLILPNRLSGGNEFMRAGETRSFPPASGQYTLRVGGPAGQDKVLAVASKRALRLDEIAQFKSGNFATVSVRGQGGLAQALSIIVEPLPPQDWVTGIAYFQVRGAQPPVQNTNGNIQVDGPQGASVFLDGQLVGKAPLTVITTPGRHTLRLTLDGYRDETRTINVETGRTIVVNLQLAPTVTTGTLQVNAPNGSSVFVDGQLVGQVTNGTLTLVQNPGRHTVRVTLDGYREFTQSITIEVGRTTVVNARLQQAPRFGVLQIAANVAGARVFINGQEVGRTGANGGLIVQNLPVGTHEVVVLAPGFRAFISQFTVQGGQVTNITAQLTRL